MRLIRATATAALVLMVGACGATTRVHAGSPNPSGSDNTGAQSAPRAPAMGHSSDPSAGSALPASCMASPQLAPIGPTPSWPAGFRIFGALPSALSTQYPTVYGGMRVAPPTAGESPVDVNSHFIVFETVHDRALEAEANSAYRAPLSVAFQVAPRSWACLQDILSSVGSAVSKQGTGGPPAVVESAVYSWGLAVPYVVVGTTACTPEAVQATSAWFAARWGDAVQLQTCGQRPTATEELRRP